MKYLWTLGFIFIYRLRLQNRPPNPGTKSTYSMWITLPKPPVTEKVLQVLQTRGSIRPIVETPHQIITIMG